MIIDARFKSDLPSLDPISFIFDVGIKDDVDITDDPDPRLVLIKNSDKINWMNSENIYLGLISGI